MLHAIKQHVASAAFATRSVWGGTHLQAYPSFDTYRARRRPAVRVKDGKLHDCSGRRENVLHEIKQHAASAAFATRSVWGGDAPASVLRL